MQRRKGLRRNVLPVKGSNLFNDGDAELRKVGNLRKYPTKISRKGAKGLRRNVLPVKGSNLFNDGDAEGRKVGNLRKYPTKISCKGAKD